MSIEVALRSILLADSAVSTAVDDRITPLFEGEQPAKPHITYTLEDSDDPAPTFEGPSGYLNTEVEFYIVADTYDEVIAITANVRRILDGYSGTNSGMKIAPCRFANQTDIEQGTLPGETTPVHMRSMRFRSFHSG